MQEKNVKIDYILCATMIMLCCRALLLTEALAVCDTLARCNLSLTYQQQCYICSHIITCFLKLAVIPDRTHVLEKIFHMLSVLRDSDVKDFAKDSASDISFYLELSHSLRQLERVLKLCSETQPELLLQTCMTSLDSRIPAGRTRAPSSSSVHSHQSSTSSSRAASPTPPVGFDAVSFRELSVAELCESAVEADQRESSALLIARVPIRDAQAAEKQESAGSHAAPAAPPQYKFVLLKALGPDSFKFLSREISEVCEEFQMTHADRSARLELMKEIDRVVNKWNPAFKVAVYGSFATGLCDRDSDIDLLVATPLAITYMQSHNVYEPTALPSPPLPPVMLDDLYILLQSDPALKKRHERPPR
jgi:hypothetical protein